MPNHLSLKILGFALLAVSFVCVSPAYAGFQWVGPSENAPIPGPSSTPMAVPAPSPASVPSIQPMDLPPPAPTGAPEPLVAMPVTPERSARATFNDEPIAPVVIEGRPGSYGSSVSGGIVQGFASQVPLAVALRQILPSGYGFSVDQNVDLGVLVSFQGGKSWRETLKEALEPAGLVMRERGQMISIGYGGASAADVTSPKPYAPLRTSRSSSSVQPRFLEPPPGVQPISSPLPPPPRSAVPYSNPSMADGWNAERGDTLRKVLEGWARRANVEVNWMAEYDYPIQASIRFSGTFEDAVRSLLTGFEAARPQPVAQLHSNPRMGQMVLVVTTRGNTGSE